MSTRNAIVWSMAALAAGSLLGCTSDGGPMCGPGTVRVGTECVLAVDSGPGLDASVPRDAARAPDAPAPDDASTGPDAPPPDAPPPARCGDGVCAPAAPGDDLADVESCMSCPDDCSASCGTHECSWVFYCAREMLCTEVTCVAGCMPEGDADAQRQYLDIYACMQDRCASMCFNGHLGGECISCVCAECPTETAACGGLSCT